jgi:hypothetical protein
MLEAINQLLLVVPVTSNEGTPFLGIPFVYPFLGHVGPPYIATLNLPRLTIWLLVWFFSTPMKVNAPSALYETTPPQDHKPHVDPLPSLPIGSSSCSSSSPSESSAASNQVDKKKKNKLGRKLPTIVVHVGSDQPSTIHHDKSVDNVDKYTKTH